MSFIYQPWHILLVALCGWGSQICVFDPVELVAPDQEPDSTENRNRPLTELTAAIELHGRRSILTLRGNRRPYRDGFRTRLPQHEQFAGFMHLPESDRST